MSSKKRVQRNHSVKNISNFEEEEELLSGYGPNVDRNEGQDVLRGVRSNQSVALISQIKCKFLFLLAVFQLHFILQCVTLPSMLRVCVMAMAVLRFRPDMMRNNWRWIAFFFLRNGQYPLKGESYSSFACSVWWNGRWRSVLTNIIDKKYEAGREASEMSFWRDNAVRNVHGSRKT